MLTLILSILVLLTSIPAGLLIAWLTKEELKAGKKWFKILVLAGVLGMIIGIFYKNWAVALTFAYMAIVAGLSWKKAE